VDEPVEAIVAVLEVGDDCLGVSEKGGESYEGRAVNEGVQEEIDVQLPDCQEDLASTLNRIAGKQPRVELVKLTSVDKSLEAARKLAQEGKGCLLFRHRLDNLGRNFRQLCLPQEYRAKCMLFAHEHFGHKGKQKCAEDVL